MKLYKIRDWEKIYENNRTRELKQLSWVPIPNNHDGDGYTCLVGHKDGAALLGGWLALVQVASKCDPRGTLLRRAGLPHDPSSLHRITRLPEELFARILDIAERECNWLVSSELQTELLIPQEGAGIPQAVAPRARARTEGNGTEGNGTEPLREQVSKMKIRVGKWFNRRESTAWSEKEESAVRKVAATDEMEMAVLEAYYTAKIEEGDYRRRDVLTLLNNWSGEIDRARAWKNGRFKPGSTSHTSGPPIGIRKTALEEEIQCHPANRSSVYYDSRCTDDQKANLAELRHQLSQVSQQLTLNGQ